MIKLTKIILVICIGILGSCTEPELPTAPPILGVENIFNATENKITDGQVIHFDLPSDGIYILTLIDVGNGQVVSRERFNGKSGRNIKRIYTKSIESRYLYLVLSSNCRKELHRTKVIFK